MPHGRFSIPFPFWSNAGLGSGGEGSSRNMQPLTAGITKAATGIDGIVWNILGQTYVPKHAVGARILLLARHVSARHLRAAAHPSDPGRVHLHAGGQARFPARRHATIRRRPAISSGCRCSMPHGIFNKSDQPVKCFFWVTPTRKLYDLFWAHSLHEGAEARRGGGARGESRDHLPAAAPGGVRFPSVSVEARMERSDLRG